MIRNISERQAIEIDLTGPEGNTFYLVSVAGNLADQMDKDGAAICAEMMEGDYEHLVEVFEREFGEVVTLYRMGIEIIEPASPLTFEECCGPGVVL